MYDNTNGVYDNKHGVYDNTVEGVIKQRRRRMRMKGGITHMGVYDNTLGGLILISDMYET